MNYKEILEEFYEVPNTNISQSQKQIIEEKRRKYDHPLIFLQLTEDQQKQLVEWCCRWEKTKTTNYNNTSYGLKHGFEESQGGFYITNGQFKGAMIIAGFTPSNPGKLNWNFNISRKSVKQIFQEAEQQRRW